ncbi:hypothetical protein [Tropicibacter naphthalenivorans]|uniref:hypothetical protein n=1 Tax=Tropicibacter naphthalenivorans TaxID=441103 RepID=UPI001356614B|nr:hypothetical protein [Tropicibacter naphthalenivorans]
MLLLELLSKAQGKPLNALFQAAKPRWGAALRRFPLVQVQQARHILGGKDAAIGLCL